MTIPDDWISGAYIAMFVEGDGSDNETASDPPLVRNTPDAQSGKAFFVVLNPNPGSTTTILYKIPYFTYQAYNREGAPEGSLYSSFNSNQVTIRRPGGGVGSRNGAGAQSFDVWDAPFIAWLEGNGYHVDYCTDLDLHLDQTGNGQMLSHYRLLLSVGHDEYWTTEMRDNVEGFVAGGGNVAFFSGNTCWWKIEFADPTTLRRVDYWFLAQPGPGPDGNDHQALNRPENALTGVSFRNGGYRDPAGPQAGIAYTVQHADHWVYADTGLNESNPFGDDHSLVGYECDGANFDTSQVPPFTPALDDGTPSGFLILAYADVSGWTRGGTPPSVFPQGNRHATMGIYTQGGTVFTVGTTDWVKALDEPRVAQITLNVIRRLSQASIVLPVDVTNVTTEN